MKKLYIILSLLTLASCQDNILNKEPLDIISDAVVWEDKDLVDAYLLRQYENTPVMVGDSQEARNAGYELTENFVGPCLTSALSDEARTGFWWWTDIESYKATGININGGISEYMELPYQTIRNLNEIIEKLSENIIDEEWGEVRIAEARFLRAFNYFAMVKRYGGVPLITKAQETTASEEELFPKRNSEQEIYDFIIGELQDINETLDKNTEAGRANKYAALALLSRVAMYAGSIAQFGKVQLDGLLGIPASEAETYYTISYNASQRIIGSDRYDLYDEDDDKVENFKNIFIVKNNVEAIFVRQHDKQNGMSSGNAWGWNFVMAPKPHMWNCGWTISPYLETVEAFEMIDGTSGKLDRNAVQSGLWSMDELWKGRDPRFYATIWTNGTKWRDGEVDLHNGLIDADGNLLENQADSYGGISAWGDQQVQNHFWTSFGVMKYCDEADAVELENFQTNSSNDYLIFRYGEILLNLAETAFELNKSDSALICVNRIRERAGMPSLASISRDAIRHERQVELAFENHRFWDVRRWRIATTELSKSHCGIRYILDYNTRKYKIEILENVDGENKHPYFPECNYYFPITLQRTMANRNLVENPGYE